MKQHKMQGIQVHTHAGQARVQATAANEGMITLKTAYTRAFQPLHQNLHSLTQQQEPYYTHYTECHSCSAAGLAELQRFHCRLMTVAIYLSHSCLSTFGLSMLKLMCNAMPTISLLAWWDTTHLQLKIMSRVFARDRNDREGYALASPQLVGMGPEDI
ncbi:TPA: hypothetical protein ACH3X1_010565 [Trebouxia sp. C0004]